MHENDFDLAQSLRTAGFESHQAEQILKTVDKKMNQNFATKYDLEKSLSELRYETNMKFKEVENQILGLKYYIDLRFNKLETKFEILLTIAVGIIVAVIKL